MISSGSSRIKEDEYTTSSNVNTETMISIAPPLLEADASHSSIVWLYDREMKVPRINPSSNVHQVQSHQFRVDDIAQSYNQATPASQMYVGLILELDDTFAQAYWNTSQENQSYEFDPQQDAVSLYP